MRLIARSEKRELNAISANISRFNLEGHAASLISGAQFTYFTSALLVLY